MSDIKTVLSVDEVLDYLGIDYADEKVNRNITRAIATADKILQGSIGVNYPIEDARSKELALIIVSDLYDVRGMTTRDNVSNNVRRLVEDMSLQLKLELGSDPYTPPESGVDFKAPYIDEGGNWYLWDTETQSYIDSGVCAMGKPGENGVDGKDGEDGKDGKDGYTPKKGVDYFTEDDMVEIQNYISQSVDSAIGEALEGDY